MPETTAKIEISPLRAIALSRDQLASLRSIQQLLNNLNVGQVVSAQLITEVVNQEAKAYLSIQDTRIELANEQLANIPKSLTKTNADQLTVRVVAISGEQLSLKVLDEQPTAKQAPEQPPAPASDTSIDAVKLLQLIEQINPALAANSKITKEIIDQVQQQLKSVNTQANTAKNDAQVEVRGNLKPLISSSRNVINADNLVPLQPNDNNINIKQNTENASTGASQNDSSLIALKNQQNTTTIANPNTTKLSEIYPKQDLLATVIKQSPITDKAPIQATADGINNLNQLPSSTEQKNISTLQSPIQPQQQSTVGDKTLSQAIDNGSSSKTTDSMIFSGSTLGTVNNTTDRNSGSVTEAVIANGKLRQNDGQQSAPISTTNNATAGTTANGFKAPEIRIPIEIFVIKV